MNSKVWIRKALSLCLVVAVYATYSMVGLASPDKLVGELTVSGKAVNGEIPVVKVNGEAAQSGRAIFSSSTITTSESSSAIINLGKIGKIELAPNTTISVSFNENGLNGDLAAGKVTALSADNVSIKTPNGKVTKLSAGESVMAAQQTDDDDDNDGGAAWWIFALILGGAAAAVVIAATTDNNDINLGGGTVVVSPNR
ncbi:MAG TPA: hypothetical protein VF604_18100 [Pyrinomonadaceae bacterium]|jgi:hypothetical protein